MEPASPPPGLTLDPASRILKLDPHRSSFVQDPYPYYAFLHAHARTFFWSEYGIWCAAGFDDVSRLLRDRRLGRQRPAGAAEDGRAGDRSHLTDFDAFAAHSMLELEPPAHTRLRTLVNRAFVSRQVESLRPVIADSCRALLDALPETQRGDLLPAYATPVPVTTIAMMLGVPTAMNDQLLDWSHRMVAMHMFGRTRDVEVAANAAAREFAAYLRGLVAERGSARRDDLLGVLVAARDEGESISDAELTASAIQLLNAGHEATVHQIGNAVRAILMQGGDPRRFFADRTQSAATVEECLRFDAPLHLFRRYAYEPVGLGPGIDIAPGEQIGLLLGAANHDPLAYEAPGSFRPDRPDQKNVSFGAGIHFCIGAPLARLELQVALEVLFDRLPGLDLAAPPRYRDTYHFRGLQRLDCTW